jgi:nucleotide-binding universal stress UspA family protein
MYNNIVVGTDGSSTAKQAVRQAAELAKVGGAKLHLVSAYRPPSQVAAFGPGLDAILVNPPSDDEVRVEVESVLAQAARESEGEGVTVERYVVPGNAAEAILEVAESQGADLVVVGSRGMGGARRFLGSVPNSVSHHANCSVLIVHTS